MIEWRQIPGVRLGYEVSNVGEVRGPRGVLSAKWRGYGYPQVSICDVAGRRRTFRVHALVLMAFVGPRPLGGYALHFDDVPTNNRLENLRWASPLDNGADYKRNRAARSAELIGRSYVKSTMKLHANACCEEP